MILATICNLLISQVFAYPMPEFRGLLERETQVVESPSRIDSEYQSDILTFRKPFLWDYQWLTQNLILDSSIGSLGAKNFLLDHRLKLVKPLTEKLEFRFHYLEYGDLETEDQHVITELAYWFTSHIGLSVYGQPSSRKSEDDLGLSLLWRPERKNSEVRLFYTATDFSRNQRNPMDDRFDKTPTTFGLVGRHWRSVHSEFIEYAWTYERPSQWQFPSRGETHHFARRSAYAKARTLLGNRYLNLLAEFENKLEANNSEFWHLHKYIVLAQMEKNWAHSTVTYGVEFARREWQTDLQQTSASPHVWYKFLADQNFNWDLGWETSAYWANHVREYEHRLNMSPNFRFTNGTIRLLLTLDMDQFGTGETWEGGAGQFQMSF